MKNLVITSRLRITATILICLSVLLFTACNNKTQSNSKSVEKVNLENALESISSKLASLSKNGRPVRLAVVPFFSAFKSSGTENKFGEYFAERSITTIKSVNQQVKLFERKRLDAITKEHALNLTGLINQDDAVKIGELIPIDYLLTGTYSKLETSIEINGRVLDVVTGEIVQTFIHQINLTNELSSLFTIPKSNAITNNDSGTSEPAETKPACYYEFEKLKDLFKTEQNKDARIKKMTNIALSIPVNIECGEYHQFYIEHLRKNKIYPKSYIDYLYNEALNYKENPDIGQLISFILRYFQSDSVVTNKEWDLGLSILKKSDNITTSYYTKYLFIKPNKNNVSIQKKRIDQLISLIKKGDINTGNPSSLERGFYHLFTSLYVRNELSDLQIYLFSKYSNIGIKGKYGCKLYDKLNKLFEQEKNFNKKKLILYWQGKMYSSCKLESRYASNLKYRLEKLYENSTNSSKDSLLLDVFKKEMLPAMKDLFPLLSKGHSKQSCINLCLKNGIIISGYTPTLDDLKLKLASENVNEKREAATLIRSLGEKAKSLEKDVARLLRRSEKLSFSGATNLQWDLLKSLENFKPTDPEIISNIFDLFKSRRHKVPNTAMEVMATLGKNSFNLMTSKFNSLEPYLQIRIVKTLANMKDLKKDTTPFIMKVYKSTSNGSVKDASEDALVRLGAM